MSEHHWRVAVAPVWNVAPWRPSMRTTGRVVDSVACAGWWSASATRPARMNTCATTSPDRGMAHPTGVIEGACRHLIGDRLDITGARWGLQGAEAILTLRAVIANGD